MLLAVPLTVMAEPTFKFRGRGNGHGVGMSQYGARGFADRGVAYHQILRHYYQGTALGTLPLGQTMRVALHASDVPAQSWTLTAHSAPMWVNWSGRGGNDYVKLAQGVTYRFSTDGSTSSVRITNANTGATVVTLMNTTWLEVWERDVTKPLFTGLTRVHDASGPQSWTNVLYQGWIRLDRGAGASADKLHLRNLVQLEDYVKCVVPREMPTSWNGEALKAQSVAARSYAYTSKNAAASFDVWCTTASQVYNGWGRWVNGRAARHNETAPGVGGDWRSDPIVDATRGQVVTYGGVPVRTFFFSTSGGYTENSENIWSASLPYLKGVPDPYEHLAGSPSHTLPDITLTSSQVRTRLLAGGFTTSQIPASISGIRVLERGASGRVLRLQLLGAAGDHKILETKADIRKFRTAFSNRAWNTTWFYVNPKTERIDGSDRYATAVEASKRAFGSAGQVVLVGGRNPADALSAAAFAAALPGGAPILLTNSNKLNGLAKSEIQRLGASKVYIVGGTIAVSEAVEADLASIPLLAPAGRVERIGGSTRYETAAMLAARIAHLKGTPNQRVFVVNGDNLVDALAVSPIAYAQKIPIVLVRAGSIPTVSATVLAAPTINEILIVGGTTAVSDAVASALPSSKRIAEGSDRYDTAVKVAQWAVTNEGFREGTVYIASGSTLVDALAAAPLIGGWRHNVLFAKAHSLPSPTTSALVARKPRVTSARLLGGASALGNGVEASVERSLE